MNTITVDGWEGLETVIDGVWTQFAGIDYTAELVLELDNMARLHKEFFRNEAGPDGAPWAENRPSTIKRKGHSDILRGIPKNRYRLGRSLTDFGRQSTDDKIREVAHVATGTYLSFGTMVPYSAIHDEAHTMPNGTQVPARRHVGLNVEFVDQMVDRVADFAVKQLAK